MANVVANLSITMMDDGNVSVEGCINQRVLAYGLLMIAHDTIKEFNDNEQKRIKPASAAERLQLLDPNGRRS